MTASSQSVLGLVADALAIGGLLAFGLPPLLRLVRRRPGEPSDAALGFLALLSAAAVLALAAQIIRYPQLDGKEIKASYLMFTAPCWAVFSVAAWVAVWRRRALRIALVAAAGLYVLSYGTSLAATFSHSYPPLPNIVEKQGYADLSVSISQTSPTPGGRRRGRSSPSTSRTTGPARPPTPPCEIRLAARNQADRAADLSIAGRAAPARTTVSCFLDFLPPGSQLDRPVRHADDEAA